MSIPFLQGGRRLGLRATPGRTLIKRCGGNAQALCRGAASPLWRRFAVPATPCGATADHVDLRGWTIGTCIVRKVTDWLEKCLRSWIVATFCPKMTAFERTRSGSEADNTPHALPGIKQQGFFPQKTATGVWKSDVEAERAWAKEGKNEQFRMGRTRKVPDDEGRARQTCPAFRRACQRCAPLSVPDR